ncbi:DUF572-domain-containing protein [Calocera cornea HHB12733]|uniref:DUF572-domain-containing protein n=1 Tax=Calocera cornea HHB12733 TaxID=1353952 RepID=A0A165FM36_9BASI|nr:DUF572-domain-containing protein [Calocera cornea HHB12733]
MQGFNKYYPPDYDPEKHKSLNSYRGIHALGDRARKIDKGILITRFELPFNIWCGTCNAHIGMGVRYNAEKRKVGAYYSTPIFAFRCKCHLCGGWFEIRTDPKNTRYVVESGARQKDEEWNPAEAGGYAIHDPEASAAAGEADPLASLEKTTNAVQMMEKVSVPRIEELQEFSERRTADPYALSSKLRRSFREEKRVLQAQQRADEGLREKYGISEEIKLLATPREGPAREREEEEAEEWRARRRDWHADEEAKRRMLEAESGFVVGVQGKGKARSIGIGKVDGVQGVLRRKDKEKNATVDKLKATLLRNTARKSDPFVAFAMRRA